MKNQDYYSLKQSHTFNREQKDFIGQSANQPKQKNRHQSSFMSRILLASIYSAITIPAHYISFGQDIARASSISENISWQMHRQVRRRISLRAAYEMAFQVSQKLEDELQIAREEDAKDITWLMEFKNAETV